MKHLAKNGNLFIVVALSLCGLAHISVYASEAHPEVPHAVMRPAESIFVCTEVNPVTWMHFQQAQGIVTKMFMQIGVNLIWLPENGSCSNATRQPLLIGVSRNTPKSTLPGALAYSTPFEGVHLCVFYDRIKATTDAVPQLLAHVLAHEITHLLQGTDQHTEDGLMKARLDGRDLVQLTHAPLGFTRWDILLLHQSLETRAAWLAAAAELHSQPSFSCPTGERPDVRPNH